MKKTITLFAISFLAVLTAGAATWTVSNNPAIPGQFTQIHEAIADAQTSAGDTFLVAGSPTRYQDFTLNKNYVIIGAGMTNPYGHSTWVGHVTLSTNVGFSPSGSYISGLWVDYAFYMNADAGSQLIENVTIERCWIDDGINMYGINGATTYRNITVQNCIFDDHAIWFDQGNYENVVVQNNLFDNGRFTSHYTPSLAGVTIKNNVFINETYTIFDDVHNLVIEDNLFFKANPQGCSGCTFTNNTSYGSLDNAMGEGVGNNLGTGNEERDPKFVNYTDASGEYSFGSGYDFHLLPVSEDDDSGTGGGQRGMYGGASPVELASQPPWPTTTEISFTDNASSVKEEGTLKVKFKAKKQD